MKTQNPHQPPDDSQSIEQPRDQPPGVVPNRAAYNVVSDLVTGANVRWRDNLFQALAILACLLLGAAIGCFFVADRPLGVLAGAVGGLVFGLFGSGVFLMIYRGLRHLRGQHD